jgi:hypothetical protein
LEELGVRVGGSIGEPQVAVSELPTLHP